MKIKEMIVKINEEEKGYYYSMKKGFFYGFTIVDNRVFTYYQTMIGSDICQDQIEERIIEHIDDIKDEIVRKICILSQSDLVLEFLTNKRIIIFDNQILIKKEIIDFDNLEVYILMNSGCYAEGILKRIK